MYCNISYAVDEVLNKSNLTQHFEDFRQVYTDNNPYVE